MAIYTATIASGYPMFASTEAPGFELKNIRMDLQNISSTGKRWCYDYTTSRLINDLNPTV